MRLIPCLLLVTLFAQSVWGRQSMLPPSTKDPSLDLLYDVEERPIWPHAPHRAVARYRVSFSGINCRSHIVRFDEFEDGSVRGEVKVWNKCKQDEPYNANGFQLSVNRFAPIKAAMAKAKLWSQAASYWTVQDQDTTCIDGVDVTFERRDSLDYRFDQSNVWCSTTREFIVAARMLLIAAGDSAGLGLLPEVSDD